MFLSAIRHRNTIDSFFYGMALYSVFIAHFQALLLSYSVSYWHMTITGVGLGQDESGAGRRLRCCVYCAWIYNIDQLANRRS